MFWFPLENSAMTPALSRGDRGVMHSDQFQFGFKARTASIPRSLRLIKDEPHSMAVVVRQTSLLGEELQNFNSKIPRRNFGNPHLNRLSYAQTRGFKEGHRWNYWLLPFRDRRLIDPPRRPMCSGQIIDRILGFKEFCVEMAKKLKN